MKIYHYLFWLYVEAKWPFTIYNLYLKGMFLGKKEVKLGDFFLFMEMIF